MHQTKAVEEFLGGANIMVMIPAQSSKAKAITHVVTSLSYAVNMGQIRFKGHRYPL